MSIHPHQKELMANYKIPFLNLTLGRKVRMKPSTILQIFVILLFIGPGCTCLKDTCEVQILPDSYHTDKNEQSTSDDNFYTDDNTLCEAEPVCDSTQGQVSDSKMNEWIIGLKRLIQDESHALNSDDDCRKTFDKIEAYATRKTFEFDFIWQSHEMEKQNGGNILNKLDELANVQGMNKNIKITREFFLSGQVPINAQTADSINRLLYSKLCSVESGSICEVVQMIISDYQDYVSIIQKTAERAHYLGND